MTAFYNEIDPYAAQWLRNLIAVGHIAPGVVDERSIEEITPDELRNYTQCHFFAGIGVWSYALRLAGVPDDFPIWTGSCPCQPFSAAGKGAGFADERHLWPAFNHLISQRRPAIVLGEQVASKDADPWIDLVQADMEAVGYAFGAIPFPSAGIGAPHIRDRLYWVANASGQGLEGWGRVLKRGGERASWPSGLADGVEHATGDGREQRGPESGRRGAATGRALGGVANASCGRNLFGVTRADQRGFPQSYGSDQGRAEPGPTNGLWRDADWLFCRDGKWRPVEPGAFPLAHGAPSRVGRLRAYGNAINAQAAVAFIEAALGR